MVAAVSCGWFLAACQSGNVPNQVLTKPAPASATVPAARAAGAWAYHPSARQQSFVIDQRATIVVRPDSASRTDTVSSHAEVSFALGASGGPGGNMLAFAIASPGRAATTPAGVSVPFPFRADYSARSGQLDFTAPRDAAPCSSPALATAQSLRDLWFRPPDTLRVGASWSDSASYVFCRDGIPLHATVQRKFELAGMAETAGRLLLTISRVSRTVLEGSGAQFGEPVSVSGSGGGQLVYSFDPASGEVVSANGTSAIDLTLRSRVRTQTVRQAVEVAIFRR